MEYANCVLSIPITNKCAQINSIARCNEVLFLPSILYAAKSINWSIEVNVTGL